MTLAKITDHPHLVRDLHTGAVLNTDHLAVRRHEKRISDLQDQQARDAEVASIKNEITEIKAMLHQLVARQCSKE